MAEFSQETKPLDIPTSESNGGSYKNVKELKSGDGSFYIHNGAIELRDSSGNIVVLIDANG